MADEPDKNQDEAAAAEETAPGGARKKTLIAYAAVALFSVVSSVTVGIVAFPSADNDAEEVEEQPVSTKKSILPVPQMIVNLQDSDTSALLQVTLSVELETTGADDAQSEFNELLPKVQDQMIKVLTSFSASEIDGGASMVFVQTRIIDQLNETLLKRGNMKVTNIYFTEFVVE